MTAAYVAIGNSDDKLPQASWAAFVNYVNVAVSACADSPGGRVYFAGFSGPAAPWQNAAWILELPDDEAATARLRTRLRELAGRFNQHSIAWGELGRLDLLTPLGFPPAAGSG